MTSFFATESYSSVLVLVTGLATFIGLWGTGAVLMRAVGMKLPSPWSAVTALLLGIQAFSFAVQIVGMTEIASRPVLSAMWLSLMAIGLAMCLLGGPKLPSWQISKISFSNPLPVAIIGIAVVTNLLIALAPSTKIDELYYHMLVPSRIVSDGGFRFYRMPWEGAIWPQMLYQIAAAPVHAIGYPDAPNVVSWGLGATLLWFAWQIIRSSEKPVIWSALWTASLCVGLYSTVWSVTAGAHAMGDLAITAAIVALCCRERLLTALSPAVYAFMFSLFTLSAGTSKISLLPLSAVLLIVGVWPLLWSSNVRLFGRIVVAAGVPWIIFYCPIALWTFVQSGSPLGPVLAGRFASSIYPADWIRETFEHTRQVNQVSLSIVSQYVAINYSPMVWLGAIGAIAATTLSLRIRVILASLLVMQVTLIYWLLPHDARFLGGLHYGLVIVFACFAKPDIVSRVSVGRAETAVGVMLLVPWLGVQVYYAKQFFPVVFGLETKNEFYKRYVAFYADYARLNQLIPKDAILLVQGFRTSSAYAPRPVFFDIADLPERKMVFLLAPKSVGDTLSLDGYKLGDIVYENAEAVIETFRTPGRWPVFGPLRATRLVHE